MPDRPRVAGHDGYNRAGRVRSPFPRSPVCDPGQGPRVPASKWEGKGRSVFRRDQRRPPLSRRVRQFRKSAAVSGSSGRVAGRRPDPARRRPRHRRRRPRRLLLDARQGLRPQARRHSDERAGPDPDGAAGLARPARQPAGERLQRAEAEGRPRRLVKRGWCRDAVCGMTRRIKRMFKCPTENEPAPASSLHALQAVSGAAGRCRRAPVHQRVTGFG